ncbi:RcnB family protein [Burkholderia pyrrocinia]|uniref:RcnB family protein n=1 Tax=Burkholderia pyrrocinia TaxID=60550 RepID=UPI001575F9C2|nr:RcnB family protein [Burkholderia pyrrocinia]NTX32552.1 RcnB family protein [Burkholderia pyrrocinia]QVN18333.1 RcnB family protein [Burkholderia pyrrocinia]
MKKMQRMMLAALIAAGCAATAAMAQDHGNYDKHDNHDNRGGPGMQRGHGPKRMPPGQAMHREDDVPPRWADQPRRDWHKGDRLPNEFRDRQYVIDDWRGYRLSPPPRGYQWVGVGGDHLLVQIGSGLVLQVGQ